MFFANRSNNVSVQAHITKLVVRADWWFTTPAIIIQPVTGLAMAHLAGLPLSTPWIAAALALFVFAGACWLPVVWLQIRMATLARKADDSASPLPASYQRLAKRWEWLGYPAFFAMLAVFWLMIAKPLTFRLF